MGISGTLPHEPLFLGEFGNYLGQNANNKTAVKVPPGNKTASKKGVMSRKLARTDTSTKYVSQSRLSNESDIILIFLDQKKELSMKPDW